MHLFKARKIAVGSAYSPAVNDVCVGFLQGNGFDVVSTRGLNVVNNLEIGRLSSQTAYDVALQIDNSDVDAIVLACTNWPTLDMVESIEQKLGKPVIATGQATAWHALRMVGYTEPIEGLGMLLRQA